VDPQIVIVVPVFNESGNIEPMAREVADAFASEARPWQLVFVDDASQDDTWEVILRVIASDPRIRGYRHARNRGQSAAVWTGVSRTSAPFICTLDGDLQNNPADLPPMLAMLDRCDFVCGRRTRRQDSTVRLASSWVARKVRTWSLGYDFADTGCALRAFKRSSLEGLFPFNGLHRFLPILVAGNGSRVLEIPVGHRPRISGVSKYGVWNRLGRGLFDLVGVAWFQRRRLDRIDVSAESGV
jgi:glycosyltransferase involved in cell wall biosynthesis